jgi:dephospho-CoA kinase
VVSVSRQQQVERAMLRSGMTADEVNARIEAQMSLAEKKKYADVVLDNSGSQEATMQAVRVQLELLLGNEREG